MVSSVRAETNSEYVISLRATDNVDAKLWRMKKQNKKPTNKFRNMRYLNTCTQIPSVT